MSVDFHALYEAEHRAVWRLAARLGVPSASVEDVTHDVFLTAYKRLDTFDPQRPARAWLFGITYRLVSDFRRLARHRFEVTAEEAHGQHAPAERLDAKRDATRIVELALSRMAPEVRDVFVLHELEGRPIPEVAALTQMKVPTAYTRLRAARLTLSEVATTAGAMS